MADAANTHVALDKLAEEYGKAEHSKQIDEKVAFYRQMAQMDTRRSFIRAVTVPGFGHFPLRHWLEGFCFLFLEIVLTGTILVLFAKSLVSIFTSDPHRWRAFLWCLGGSVVFRIASLVRVVLLANKIKSDAAYLLLRLAEKKPPAST